MKPHLKLNNTNDIYYNCNKFYSYPDAFLALIDGGRGIGKTTTFNIKGISNYFNKGQQFIYMRRYKPELKEFIKKDSLGKIIDDVIYKPDGNGGCDFIWGDDVFGYGISLSTTRSYKSADFSKVNLIIFDEAFLHKGAYHYLQDEVETMLEFVSTVYRTRTGGRVVIMGNNEDLFNPYYSYFNIPIFKNQYYDSKRGIYCEHAINSPKLLEMEKKTSLYKLIDGTAYGDYHYNNAVLLEKKAQIGTKPENSTLIFRVIMNENTINVYMAFAQDNTMSLYGELKNKVINDKLAYTILQNGNPNYFYCNLYKSKLKALVYNYYFNDKMYFDSEKCASIFSWIVENI